jgi:hypothetical protein
MRADLINNPEHWRKRAEEIGSPTVWQLRLPPLPSLGHFLPYTCPAGIMGWRGFFCWLRLPWRYCQAKASMTPAIRPRIAMTTCRYLKMIWNWWLVIRQAPSLRQVRGPWELLPFECHSGTRNFQITALFDSRRSRRRWACSSISDPALGGLRISQLQKLTR